MTSSMPRGERGAVAPLVAMMLLGLLALAALVIDADAERGLVRRLRRRGLRWLLRLRVQRSWARGRSDGQEERERASR